MKTRQDIQNLLNKLPHTLQVTFALHCCNDIKHLITDPRSIEVLHLVEKWLHNPNSVTSRELYDAASYAANAASASYAANAAYAAYAANAAYAASAANAAANAAAYVATNAAANSACAAEAFWQRVNPCKVLRELIEVTDVCFNCLPTCDAREPVAVS